MMKVTLVVEYDDAQVSANRLSDSLLEIEGVEGVEVADWEDVS